MQDELNHWKQKYHDLQVLYDRLFEERTCQDSGPQLMLLQSKCIQLERQVRRLKRANDARQDMIIELENVAFQFDEIAAGDTRDIDLEFLQRFSRDMLSKMQDYRNANEAAERQRFFVPHGSVYLRSDGREQQLQGMYSNDSTASDLPALNVHSVSALSKNMTQLYSLLITAHVELERTLLPTANTHNDKIISRVTGDLNGLTQAIADCSREMVELGAVVPGMIYVKPRSQAVDLRFDAAKDSDEASAGHFSISTREIISRLPMFSRNRKECEQGLRSLVRSFHAQRNIWQLEKRALLDQIDFLGIMGSPQNAAPRQQSTPSLKAEHDDTVGKPLFSRDEKKALKNAVDNWRSFETNSTEDTLRTVLNDLGQAVPIVARLLKSSRKREVRRRSPSRKERNPETAKEEHYEQQEKYEREKQRIEDKLRRESMYMEADLDDISTQSSVSSRIKSSRQSSSSFLQQSRNAEHAQTRSVISVRPSQHQTLLQQEYEHFSRGSVDPLKFSYNDSTTTIGAENAPSTSEKQRTALPVQRKVNSSTQLSQQTNISALEHDIAQSRTKIAEMQEIYEDDSTLSEARRFALKKKIQQENATVLRLQRTLRQCTG